MSNAVLLLQREVIERTRLSRSSIARLAKKGTFPAPVRIGEKRVAWRAADIDAWLSSRTIAPDYPAPTDAPSAGA